MLKKRGQITIFILFGIVILIAVGFIFYAKSETTRIDKDITDIPSETLPIKLFVDSCIKQTLEEGVNFISLQGGYYNVPEPKTEELIFQIPYYFYLGENKFPRKEIIEKELSNYIKDNLPACINNFVLFDQSGFKFETKEISVKSILEKTIFVDINYPIIIKKADSIIKIEKFSSKNDFDFESIYDILSNFTVEHQKNPDFIPLGFLSLLAYRNDFSFDLNYLPENSVAYSFIFYNLFNKNKTLLYNFASKYNWSEIKSRNTSIKIFPIPLQTAYPGYEYSYQVKATNNKVKFSDYSELFDIDGNTGFINFTPTLEDRGLHNILIVAYDDKGNQDTEILQLNIIAENHPPVIEYIEDIEMVIGETLNLTIIASDQDSDILFYLVESSLDNFEINMLTGKINFNPKISQEGDYTITLTVVDPKGEKDQTRFNIKIKNEE